MSSDPTDRSDASDASDPPVDPAQTQRPEDPAATEPDAAPKASEAADSEATGPVAESPESDQAGQSASKPAQGPPKPPRRCRQILIGSQRDPAAYRPKPKRSWIPVVSKQPKTKPPDKDKKEKEETPPTAAPDSTAPPTDTPTDTRESPPEQAPPSQPPLEEPDRSEVPVEPIPSADHPSGPKLPPPNIRDKLPPDLEAEFEEALADVALDDLIAGDEAVTRQAMLEPKSKHTGQILIIRREDVFVELGGREQGILPLKQFPRPPEIGAEIEVVVTRFNPEDGLYELTLPHAAADVGDWSDLEDGMIVEARVTGHNTGGLECEVNHIRGFIPFSQIALYRVENLAQFVGEKFTCLVTEANPQRRNLVLSRRAVLQREREEVRQNLLQSLAPGQIHEGVVRKLMDFGAFVDLGGVDGLLHISQLSFGRINHPSEVLSEGQTVKVKIEKVDTDSGRISLAYRDMLESPWVDVEKKYPVNTTVRGKVTKLMEFGAFVQLEPGVEGLVHISELSHKRVWRPSDVVKEGEEVDVLVQSVDREAQRISLSMKDLIEPLEQANEVESSEPGQPAPSTKTSKQPSGPLKGGLGGSGGGEKFGLKW